MNICGIFTEIPTLGKDILCHTKQVGPADNWSDNTWAARLTT